MKTSSLHLLLGWIAFCFLLPSFLYFPFHLFAFESGIWAGLMVIDGIDTLRI